MNNKQSIIVMVTVIVIIACFGFISEARAQTYYATGTLISKNLFSGEGVKSIDYFGYNCTTTATATLKVQFSQDNSNWYDSSGSTTTWDTLSDGNRLDIGNAIDLSTLNWSSSNFYYKMKFETSDTSTTPVLDEIKVYFTFSVSVTTQTPTNVTPDSAVGNGNITAIDGGNVTTRGFKYGLTETDTWDVHEDGSFGTGSYSLDITGLSANTTYYIRAYTINPEGTSYGNWVSFTTENYYSSGTQLTKNLFSGEEVIIIDSFYTSSTVPAVTALWVQFSTTSETWYSANGVENGWTYVPNGKALIPLSDLEWSGPNFYYKMKFETYEQGKIPVLDEIQLNYNIFHSPQLKGSIRLKGGVKLR